MRRRIAGVTLIAAASAAVGLLSASAGATADETTRGTGSPSGAGVSRAMAAPEPKTVTVPATRVINVDRDSRAPDDRCLVVVLYEFAHVAKTTSATLTYAVNGTDRSVQSAPPYSDTYPAYELTRTAPAGRHWIQTSFGAIAGADQGHRCDSEIVPKIEATTAATGTVELTTTAKLKPKLKLKLNTVGSHAGDAGTTPPNDVTLLEVQVVNVGNEPAEGVQVRGVSTKAINTTCKKNPVTPERQGPLGRGGTLQPGQALAVQTYKFKEVCPGSAKATVRAIASGGVEETKSTTIKVPDTAYIMGTVSVAPVAESFPMPTPEANELTAGLRIRAVGKKKTFTARPNAFGRYRIKVPNGALGRYELAPVSKTAEAVPDLDTVKAVRGKAVEAKNFELGHACHVRPPNTGFIPINGAYRAPGLEISYSCRTQRVFMYDVPFFESESTTCTRSDGSTYELTRDPDGQHLFVLSYGISDRLSGGGFELQIFPAIEGGALHRGPAIQVTGTFAGPRRGTFRMSHPDCSALNREGEFEGGF